MQMFPFGCIGSFRRAQDGNHKRTNIKSQCLLGTALGRSKFTNGMVFYSPILDSFAFLQTISLIKIITLVRYSLLTYIMGG